MKLLLFQNEKNKSMSNCIELFGLSRAGKTHFLKHLKTQGKQVILPEDFSKLQKTILFIKYLLKNFLSALSLFFLLNKTQIKLKNLFLNDRIRIEILRNSYLASVFAKLEYIKKLNSEFFIDEFLLQSLFIFLQNKSNKEEIKKIINKLPQISKILLVEKNKKERYSRIKQTRFPAQQINTEYAIKWMENSEFNYRIIREIILETYGPVIKNPKI